MSVTQAFQQALRRHRVTTDNNNRWIGDALIPSLAGFPLEILPQEIFTEITSYLAFEDKRNLSLASKACYLRSGILKPANRRQWIRYLETQCRYLPSNRLHLKSYSSMEVCEACLEIVPYQVFERNTHNWWIQTDADYLMGNPDNECIIFRTANCPIDPANYVGVCNEGGIRWTHEQWEELACRRCRYYRREMARMLCIQKRQCKKWQVEKKVPVIVSMWKKIKTIVKVALAAGKRVIRRGLGRRGFEQLTG